MPSAWILENVQLYQRKHIMPRPEMKVRSQWGSATQHSGTPCSCYEAGCHGRHPNSNSTKPGVWSRLLPTIPIFQFNTRPSVMGTGPLKSDLWLLPSIPIFLIWYMVMCHGGYPIRAVRCPPNRLRFLPTIPFDVYMRTFWLKYQKS